MCEHLQKSSEAYGDPLAAVNAESSCDPRFLTHTDIMCQTVRTQLSQLRCGQASIASTMNQRFQWLRPWQGNDCLVPDWWPVILIDVAKPARVCTNKRLWEMWSFVDMNYILSLYFAYATSASAHRYNGLTVNPALQIVTWAAWLLQVGEDLHYYHVRTQL